MKADAVGSEGEGSQVLYDRHTSSGNLNFSKMKGFKSKQECQWQGAYWELMQTEGHRIRLRIEGERWQEAPIHPRARPFPQRLGFKAKRAKPLGNQWTVTLTRGAITQPSSPWCSELLNIPPSRVPLLLRPLPDAYSLKLPDPRAVTMRDRQSLQSHSESNPI